jgi:hypothetical protein
MHASDTFGQFRLHPDTTTIRFMNMKKNGTGKNKIGLLAALACASLFASATAMSASLTEAGQEPWDSMDSSLIEIDEARRLPDSGSDYARLPLLDDSWDVGGPAMPYVRPDRRRTSIFDDCEINVGVGGTYHSFEGTNGVVIPMTVTWNRSRWEFGLFHFSEQTSSDNPENVERLVAQPYWGASLSRRFQLFERGPLRAIFGFGLSYRTETDVLSATNWNFSSQFGLRYRTPQFPATIELSARHWSNGGVRTPNRGQDFTILTVRFDR